MIKRFFSIIIAASFLLALPFAANADVLVEPNNDFYTRHRNECTYLNRSFYANGPSGSVSVKLAPDTKKEIAVIENGESIWIQFTYNHNGQIWGAAITSWDWDKPDGWIPMEQLLLIYDYISFEKEHQEEFYTYSGDYEALYEVDDIVFWTWPGSGVWDLIFNAASLPEDIGIYFDNSNTYRDEQGREWGFIGYMYGKRNFWICLSEPDNKDIPAFNPAPQPKIRQPQDNNTGNTGNTGVTSNTDTVPRPFSMPVFIIILVVIVVIGTVVLIKVLWKSGKGGS